jgi:serine/threonine-protein kinase
LDARLAVTVNEFLELLRRSQLVEEDQLTKFLGGVAARQTENLPDPAQAIASALITQNLLTEYQAEKLMAGKYKGFYICECKLMSRLGTRGMGHEFLAEHVHTKQKMVLGVLPRSRVEDSTYLDRWLVDVGEGRQFADEHAHYIVTEYRKP